MRDRFQILAFAFVVGAMLVSCEKRVPELKVVTNERATEDQSRIRNWEKLPSGLFRAEFELPPSLSGSYTSEKTPEQLGNPAKKVLERAGIKFGEGASVLYSISKSVLIVTQTQEQLELVETYAKSLYGNGEK